MKCYRILTDRQQDDILNDREEENKKK